jgi:membrane protease YdiL (CAAX protease family)
MSNASSSGEPAPVKKPDLHNKAELGSPLRALAVTVLIYLAIQLVLLVFSIILITAHHDTSYSLNDSAPAEFVAILAAEALTIYLVLRILKKRRLPLSVIGLGRRPAISDFWKGILAFAVFFFVFFGIALLIYSLSPDITNQKQDVGFTNLKSQSDTILAFIALVLLPPLGEEVLFRGYFYSALRRHWTFISALLATSLLFGSAQLLTGDTGLLWIAGIETFILSCVLVYLRERTGALYAGMLVHMLNNLLAFFVIIK